MTDNDQRPAPPVPDEEPTTPTVAGIMIASGDLAVTRPTDSDQEPGEDQ